MIERYTLRVFDAREDYTIFVGHFRSFNKVIHFASCFYPREVNIEITDNFKDIDLDDDLVTSLILEVKEGFRVYEVCD